LHCLKIDKVGRCDTIINLLTEDMVKTLQIDVELSNILNNY